MHLSHDKISMKTKNCFGRGMGSLIKSQVGGAWALMMFDYQLRSRRESDLAHESNTCYAVKYDPEPVPQTKTLHITHLSP